MQRNKTLFPGEMWQLLPVSQGNSLCAGFAFAFPLSLPCAPAPMLDGSQPVIRLPFSNSLLTFLRLPAILVIQGV